MPFSLWDALAQIVCLRSGLESFGNRLDHNSSIFPDVCGGPSIPPRILKWIDMTFPGPSLAVPEDTLVWTCLAKKTTAEISLEMSIFCGKMF